MALDGATRIVVMDTATASVMAQVLPLLLLTLMVEVRRNALHRPRALRWFARFLVAFGLIETVFVLSIDGALFPFQWGDLLSALAICALLTGIYVVSFADARSPRGKG